MLSYTNNFDFFVKILGFAEIFKEVIFLKSILLNNFYQLFCNRNIFRKFYLRLLKDKVAVALLYLFSLTLNKHLSKAIEKYFKVWGKHNFNNLSLKYIYMEGG